MLIPPSSEREGASRDGITVWTGGYRNRDTNRQLPVEQFLTVLQREEITLVADVRYLASGGFGRSAYNGQTLAAHLRTAGIAYERFRELGNPERRDPTMQRFRQLLEQEADARLRRLLEFINRPGQRVLLLCACAQAEACHRGLIANLLQDRGYRIHHL